MDVEEARSSRKDGSMKLPYNLGIQARVVPIVNLMQGLGNFLINEQLEGLQRASSQRDTCMLT